MPDRQHPNFAVQPVRARWRRAVPAPVLRTAGGARRHNWLISQRGVATVEPLRRKQGAWRAMAGSPSATWSGWTRRRRAVRYRREQLAVHRRHSVAGSLTAPGVPGGRGGLSTARHRRRSTPRTLQRWIDYLHRWDPARWPPANVTVIRSGTATIAFGVASQPRRHQGNGAAVPLRLPRHPRGRPGAGDRRCRAAPPTAGAGVPAASSGPTTRTVGPVRPAESARLAEFARPR